MAHDVVEVEPMRPEDNVIAAHDVVEVEPMPEDVVVDVVVLVYILRVSQDKDLEACWCSFRVRVAQIHQNLFARTEQQRTIRGWRASGSF